MEFIVYRNAKEISGIGYLIHADSISEAKEKIHHMNRQTLDKLDDDFIEKQLIEEKEKQNANVQSGEQEQD